MMGRAVPLLFVLALAACAPAPTDGALDVGPFADAPDGEWAWRPVPRMTCRDGSATGVGVRREGGARRLAVIFQGGGLCLTAETCERNRASFGAADFEAIVDRRESQPSFSDADGAPFAGWNAVFVPYCTGDLHAGRRPDGAVPGVGPQRFVGAANVDAVLARLAPAGGRAEAVVLVGSSAGGYGATFALDRAADALAPAPVRLVADAGPLLPRPAFSAAFEAALADRFGLDLGDCSTCAPGADGLAALVPHLARTHPDAALGVVAHADDRALRNLASAADPTCRRYGDPRCRLSTPAYRAGLAALGDTFSTLPNAGLFVAPGAGHATLISASFDAASADGLALPGWLSALAAGDARSAGSP